MAHLDTREVRPPWAEVHEAAELTLGGFLHPNYALDTQQRTEQNFMVEGRAMSGLPQTGFVNRRERSTPR